MLNLQPGDVNRLRELMAMGKITEDDLAGMALGGSMGAAPAPAPQNELARILSPQEQFAAGGGDGPLPVGSMRNEETGRVTYFKPGGGGFSDKPYPAQGQIPEQAKRQKVRLVGMGNDGSQTDLGEEDARALPIDYTRPGIDLPGIGKARYTADGRYAVVNNPDGSQTKVVLGYDAAASDRRTLRDLKMREMSAQASEAEARAGLLQDKRTMLAAGPAQTASDASEPLTQKQLEAKYGNLEKGFRWTQDGKPEPIPGANQKVTDAQDVLAILDQAEPLLDKSTGSYGGFAVDKLMQLFGQSTEGANAAASLKALQGLLVSKMPKMSGPQSDKDVLLYKEMAGQIGDPTIPAEQKRAAMQTIREINERYAGGGGSQQARRRVETDALPDPRQYVGKTMTDTKTGLSYKSTGTNWVRQ